MKGKRMKVMISLVICLVLWVVSEGLLIGKYDMGFVGILLLGSFGGGAAGSVLFTRLLVEECRKIKSVE